METVTIVIDGRLIGKIAVNATAGCPADQVAATAYMALRNDAEFLVDGQTFTSRDCDEFFA